MAIHRRAICLSIMALLILLAGCTMGWPKRETATPRHESSQTSAPQAPKHTGVNQLDQAVAQYESGDYDESFASFKQALKAGLAKPADRSRAYKYLAFISCSRENQKACRDYFRKARQADPKFSLSATEAGHPLWGPVYEQVMQTSPKNNLPSTRP